MHKHVGVVVDVCGSGGDTNFCSILQFGDFRNIFRGFLICKNILNKIIVLP